MFYFLMEQSVPMRGLKAALDRNRKGTHYSDRMHRILGVCQQCGILSHSERVNYRDGTSEVRRVDDVEPVGKVLVTPQYEKYGLFVNPRVLPRLKTMAPQFAYALNVPSTSVEVEGNVVYVRVAKARAAAGKALTFGDAWSIAPEIPVGSLLLGVDEDHRQLVLELVSPTNVHAAVIGMTASGKSTLMRTMALSAQRIGGAKVALFDPSLGFQPLSGHPSVWRGGLFSGAGDCEAGLDSLARSIGMGNSELTYVFVDEVPELVMQRPRIREHLARLAQAGRHAGIHLVLGAQHPLASDLGSTTLRNIPVRLVGRVSDRTAAYNAAGRGDSGAESLRGSGDFVVINGSAIRHFQAAIVPGDELESLAVHFPPRKARVPIRPRIGSRSVLVARRAPDADGLGGRPLDDIPFSVIEEIQKYVREQGKPPSSNWVYRLTRDMLPTGGYNRKKSRRAIEAAQQAMTGRHIGAQTAQ